MQSNNNHSVLNVKREIFSLGKNGTYPKPKPKALKATPAPTTVETAVAEAVQEEKPGKKKPQISIPLQFYYDLFKDRWPYCAYAEDGASGEVITHWNGVYHETIGGQAGVAMAAEWLSIYHPADASASKAEGCFKFAASMLRTSSPRPKKDPERAIIPCEDGYLELHKNGEILGLQADPDLGMTSALSVKCHTKHGQSYQSTAFTPESKFMAFLDNALPDKRIQALIQEQCGMSLIAKNFQMATWWWGEAGSGKSTLAEICGAMQHKVANVKLRNLDSNFGLEPLVGSSLILVDEVEEKPWCESTWKSLVSQNGVSVNRKNEKALANYHFDAKWIITSNPKPFIMDKSEGVWRRLCIVQWKNVVPETMRIDNFYKVVLKEEGDAILSWMIEGAMRLIMRGRFMASHELPPEIARNKEVAQMECDSVRLWIREDEARLSPNFMRKSDVYNGYLEWCERVQVEPLTAQVFWRGVKGKMKDIVEKTKKSKDAKGKWVQSYIVNIEFGNYDTQYLNAQDEVPFG